MSWRTRWGGKQELRTLKEKNGIVDIGANEFIKMAKILGYETNNLDIFYSIRSRKERQTT